MSSTVQRHPVTPPTLADVAERAGVSRQTVSNAVNNPELLREDTLRRVQEAIAELGYLPNRAARNLRTRSSHLIGLPIKPAEEGTANAAMDRFVHSLVDSSRAVGYHVLLFSGQRTGYAADELPAYDDLLRSTAVDAFVVTDTYLGNPQAAWLNERRAPFVAFGRPWNDPDARHPWVDVDGAAGGDLATTHLIERGHHRIAWIGWRKDSLLGEDRRAGWSRAMRSRDIPTTGLASRVEDTVASGREASAVLLDEAQPTAFVCASDTLAMGVLHTLYERGLKPGQDVAVTGFDDSLVAQTVPPGLTSVRLPLEQVAIEVVHALEGLLGAPPVVGAGVLLEPTLVVRGSS
ncbi:LacI family DNA-binding transcriptional regulator [Nocardioides anomalus]|uniref:LacI family DNA-binding transcriptional regulator n=1 Tax=Nocardioides anomalus TaxID=2712223 RepID=UPI001E341C76|nr:LacI family DNA-binding transcriptional regulator [Nocardioides anomalus]